MVQANEGSNSGKSTRSKKFLIFTLGDERFAVPLFQVKEVVGLPKITPVPDVPRYFKGLINLRGRIISALDLRDILNIPLQGAVSKKPCIVISELHNVVLGTIVDDVAEVIGLDENQIEHQLDIASKVSREYITGVAKFENKPLTLLLDIAKVLNIEEFAAVRRKTSEATGVAA